MAPAGRKTGIKVKNRTYPAMSRVMEALDAGGIARPRTKYP